MTTLAALANRAQNVIGDEGAGTWTQQLVEEWTVEGIRDYNKHLPRQRSTTIACTTDVREYDLPADFRRVASVEYPDGEDPPLFLEQRSHTGGWFWGRTGYFDIIFRSDATDASELILSEKPTTGESIALEYVADHDLTLAAEDTITIPARHEGVIIEFVLWRAWLERLAGEQRSPTSNSSLLMSQYASNADRAKRSYVEALARALRGEEGKSERVNWKLDKWDRVY